LSHYPTLNTNGPMPIPRTGGGPLGVRRIDQIPYPMAFDWAAEATTAVAGAVAAARGTATPVAIDPAATVARMARVMIRFAFIESSMAKAEVRSLRPGNSTAHTTTLSCRVITARRLFSYALNVR